MHRDVAKIIEKYKCTTESTIPFTIGLLRVIHCHDCSNPYHHIPLPTCIDPSDKHNNLPKKYEQTSKITQSLLKEFFCVEIKSPTLLIVLGCFYEKYAKMHERNIARPRMPICRLIKILD
jgi:hypothetical protein